MLHRETDSGYIAISQTAHAWVSGQLAQSWGNRAFGAFAPWEEVCLGAEQHDIGWLLWEHAPTWNPATGRPHTFMELPVETHIGIWSNAAPLALAIGRYPALLTSLHGAGLYAAHDTTQDTPETAQRIRDFLERERLFQEEILATLRADPTYAPYATPEVVARNRRLVAVWDLLSLRLCWGFDSARTVEHVPTADGETTLTLTPKEGDRTYVTVSPWPFREPTVPLTVEGRALTGRFPDEAALRVNLPRAPWATLSLHLLA